jgi:acetylornithine/N-succinyldiaminopimelate aminotransferase
MSDRGAAVGRPDLLMPTYPPPPVTFVRGEGSWLYDEGGRRYLDFLGGLAVTSLGHSHPRVAEAVARQAGVLQHVSNLYGNLLAPRVAEELDRLAGGGGKVFFCNSGAEANECAIKLARRWGGRGRHWVVSAYGSFHGRTLATLHATGQPEKHEAFQPLPEGFRHVAWADLAALEQAAMSSSTVAVMLEPLQGEGGVNELPPGYLAEVRRICDEHGLLMVMDEVQTGLGRTGAWFGFQHDGVVPDVVTVAKALGNGMPIGACWARADVAERFRPGDHGSTFGGQPLAASAALATLQVMQEEDVPARARSAGALLRDRLSGLPRVRHVRGRGLLLGAALEGGGAADVTARALASGLVVNAVAPDTVRLAPSLLVSEHEIEVAVELLGEALVEAGGSEAGAAGGSEP